MLRRFCFISIKQLGNIKNYKKFMNNYSKNSFLKMSNLLGADITTGISGKNFGGKFHALFQEFNCP